jgi:hypothetical protein
MVILENPNKDDRGARMLENPAQYAKDEWARARREVAEEMRREALAREEEMRRRAEMEKHQRHANLRWWQRVFHFS